MKEFDKSSYDNMLLYCKDKHNHTINKLINILKEQFNINYDEDKWNIILAHNDKKFVLAKEVFFRLNGQCVIFMVQIIKNKPVDVITHLTDDMFYGIWKRNILDFFNLE